MCKVYSVTGIYKKGESFQPNKITVGFIQVHRMSLVGYNTPAIFKQECADERDVYMGGQEWSTEASGKQIAH